MYYPYFRGKQYELITVRESAKLLEQSGFIPIIEPVKESLNGLVRALDAVSEAGGKAVLIANPYYGDHSDNAEAIEALFSNQLKEQQQISAGIILSDRTTVDDASKMASTYNSNNITFIHAGFTQARSLAKELGESTNNYQHIFIKGNCGKLYQNNFEGAHRVLLRDGFKRRINRKHPSVEFFSDLHATFKQEGMNGFGDFLIVGDGFSETGGPAYAIAIHLTFIDPSNDNEMHVHHFKSIRQDTPRDPGGKFSEALNELVAEVEKTETPIKRTKAVEEFLELHKRGHFPGLGYVKKLSMLHHIETLAIYLQS